MVTSLMSTADGSPRLISCWKSSLPLKRKEKKRERERKGIKVMLLTCKCTRSMHAMGWLPSGPAMMVRRGHRSSALLHMGPVERYLRAVKRPKSGKIERRRRRRKRIDGRERGRSVSKLTFKTKQFTLCRSNLDSLQWGTVQCLEQGQLMLCDQRYHWKTMASCTHHVCWRCYVLINK